MRCFGGIAVVLSLLVAAPAAHAEKRIALLIGNQSYTSEIGKLANPHNDIALLEKALKGLQFEVTSVRDAGLATLHQAVNAYARRVKAAGPNTAAFLYYAGHGAADAGTNYLIPVDVKSAEEPRRNFPRAAADFDTIGLPQQADDPTTALARGVRASSGHTCLPSSACGAARPKHD